MLVPVVRAKKQLAVALFLLLQVACGDDGTPSDLTGALPASSDSGAALSGAKFSEIYPMLFPSLSNPRCDSCHAMPASEISNGKLHMGMDRAAAYAALFNKPSAGKKCLERTLVVPGQPEMSLLLQKLSANPPCGSRMPIGGAPLSDPQLEMVRSWIAAGAKDD